MPTVAPRGCEAGVNQRARSRRRSARFRAPHDAARSCQPRARRTGPTCRPGRAGRFAPARSPPATSPSHRRATGRRTEARSTPRTARSAASRRRAPGIESPCLAGRSGARGSRPGRQVRRPELDRCRASSTARAPARRTAHERWWSVTRAPRGRAEGAIDERPRPSRGRWRARGRPSSVWSSSTSGRRSRPLATTSYARPRRPRRSLAGTRRARRHEAACVRFRAIRSASTSSPSSVLRAPRPRRPRRRGRRERRPLGLPAADAALVLLGHRGEQHRGVPCHLPRAGDRERAADRVPLVRQRR